MGDGEWSRVVHIHVCNKHVRARTHEGEGYPCGGIRKFRRNGKGIPPDSIPFRSVAVQRAQIPELANPWS